MSLARLDLGRTNAPIGSLRPAHIGVFATTEARINHDLCSSSPRQSKDPTFGILCLRLAPSLFVCIKACMCNFWSGCQLRRVRAIVGSTNVYSPYPRL